jgi:MATE family multidrug resistance protein
MAIVSLGGLFTTITGLALGSGILSGKKSLLVFLVFLYSYDHFFFLFLAIDTLVAQAFTGSNNPHTIGVILQRGILIATLFAIPVCCIW